MDRSKEKKILARAIDKASTLHSFRVREEKNKLNVSMLAIVGLVGIALITYFAISQNYLASFLFFLAGITVAIGLYSKNKNTQNIICKIKTEGVQINDDLYPYENLKSFWIFYDPPYHQELSIRSKKMFTGGYIKIPLGEEDPLKIRKFLIKFIPEKKQEEALVDVFARMVGL